MDQWGVEESRDGVYLRQQAQKELKYGEKGS